MPYQRSRSSPHPDVTYTIRVNLVATVGLVGLTNRRALKESGGNTPQTQVPSARHSAQLSLAKNGTVCSRCSSTECDSSLQTLDPLAMLSPNDLS